MTRFSRLNARLNETTTKTMGRPVEYRSQTGGVFEITAVSWSSYSEVAELGVPVQVFQPKLVVLLADFPEGVRPRQNDRVVIGADIFRISSVQMDKGYQTADLFLQV